MADYCTRSARLCRYSLAPLRGNADPRPSTKDSAGRGSYTREKRAEIAEKCARSCGYSLRSPRGRADSRPSTKESTGRGSYVQGKRSEVAEKCARFWWYFLPAQIFREKSKTKQRKQERTSPGVCLLFICLMLVVVGTCLPCFHRRTLLVVVDGLAE